MAPSPRDAIEVLRLNPVEAPRGSARFEALVAFAAAGNLAPGRGSRLTAALDQAGFLAPEALSTASLQEVVDALRDSRIEANPKLVRLLQRLAAWFRDHREDLEFEPGPGEDRPRLPLDGLSAIHGVGRATADAIALRVFGSPVYPVDRASYRVMIRHGWIDPTADYDEASQVLATAAEGDAAMLAALADAFETIGRRYCKASGPHCDHCPLKVVLPEGGPVDVNG
jgi:endonuclease-3 related protein